MMPYDFSGDKDLDNSTNKFMLAGTILMVLMILVFPLYLSVEPSNRADARSTQKASLIDTGSQLFDQNCASCHGAAGEGGDSPALDATQFLQTVSDEQISSIIATGVPGTEMPAWAQDFGGPLTSEQVKSAVTYIRSLEALGVDNPGWRQGKPAN